jgi:hypothetical protein
LGAGDGAREDRAAVVLQDGDHVGPAAELVVIDVAHVGRPELVPAGGRERHLPLLFGWPPRLVQAVEGAIGGEDASTRPRAQVHADLGESRVDPEGAEVGIALETPDGFDGLQIHLANAGRPPVRPVLEALYALLDPPL